MNTDAYNLSDSYVSVGGDMGKSLDDFARKWVGRHYLISFVLILVLTLLLLWLVFWRGEGFMPTTTLRFQQRDGLGESAEGGPAVTSAQPGSPSWQILNSKDFDCANRSLNHEDAWAWQENVMRTGPENAQGGLNDSDFSKIAAGF